MLRFNTQNLGAPFFSDFFIVVEVGSEGLGERVEGAFIFRSNVGNGDGGGVFHVDQFSESGLVLDEAIGDIHLSAESGEPEDQFNWVNIVSNNN